MNSHVRPVFVNIHERQEIFTPSLPVHGIRPLADDVVKQKYTRTEKQSIIISHKDRARLWKDDADFPPWAWVYDSINCGFSDLEEQIKLLARKDKCRIRFAQLFGPDCAEKSPHDDTDYQMTIVSDVAREFAQGQNDGCPTFHPTCFGPWKKDNSILRGDDPVRYEETIQQEREALNRHRKIAAGKDHARRAVDEVYNSVPTLGAGLSIGTSDLAVARFNGLLGLTENDQSPTSPAMKETFATQFARLGNPCWVSICWQRSGTHRKSFRCLLTTPEQHQPFRGISSSRIQEKMHELKGYKLRSALESMALSPDLLWDMLLPKRMQMPRLSIGMITDCALHCSMEISFSQTCFGPSDSMDSESRKTDSRWPHTTIKEVQDRCSIYIDADPAGETEHV